MAANTFALIPASFSLFSALAVSLRALAPLAGASLLFLPLERLHFFPIVECSLCDILAIGAAASFGGADLSCLHALAVAFHALGFCASAGIFFCGVVLDFMALY